MTITDTGWQARAARLADRLEADGVLHDPAWRDAVAAVPRHVFVPAAVEQDPRSFDWKPVDVSSPEGMDRVYSPETLVTAVADDGTAISSSTKPDLIVHMLETLDVRDGHRVLAVGTGTGYTTALLTHRLGERNVYSVDIEETFVEAARQRLATLGFRPTLATVDGAEGLPKHAPYDRIIATCSVPSVPWAWAEQLAPGGKALVHIQPVINAGNLVLLHCYPDRLEGRFTPWQGSFMPMRHHSDEDHAAHRPRSQQAQTRMTVAPPNPWWDNAVVWLLAQFHGLPAGVLVGMELDPDTHQPTAGTLMAPDGSWATISLDSPDGRSWEVTESGPTPLWRSVEQAHQLYERAGRPGWERLGVTATARRQWVWLDDSDGPLAWDLRLPRMA